MGYDVAMHALHQQILDAINTATAGMTEEQLKYHPEGKWSSSGILEHLNLAFSGTAKMMERCLAEGKPLGDKPSLKQRVLASVVTDVGYFPEGRTAPKMVTPTETLGGVESLEMIRETIQKMDVLYAKCQERFGDTIFLANHPVLGPLKGRQWPRFHFVHTKHHMKQITRLREQAPGR